MKIGVSAFAWTSSMRGSNLSLVHTVRDFGFDAFEIPCSIRWKFLSPIFAERLKPVRWIAPSVQSFQQESTPSAQTARRGSDLSSISRTA